MKIRSFLSVATPFVAVSTLASCSLVGDDSEKKVSSTVSEPPKAGPVSAPSKNAESHSETVSYKAPDGDAEMGISVTTDNGVITAVSIEPKASGEVSKKIQTGFAGAVSGAVVGKDVKTLSASAIAGASLTTDAFVSYVRTLD